ncbi:MAG TPA: hypothetical protein VHB51_01940 [Candidatus Saccharimonadales bacterium]|nr:hypothetical protein [Candidatus Saccharimonadales bacterium]
MSQAQPTDSSAVDEQKVLGAEQTPQTADDAEKTAAVADYAKVVDGKPVMNVKVYSPFNDYYDGPAFSISAENATGPFDILPKHHTFISLLNPCEMVLRTVDKGEQRIRIGGGIMHVKADKVVVFLDV